MTKQQYMIVGAIAALVAFIAVGITLIVSDSEDNKNKDEVVIGTTTPTSPTTTLPPATTPTTPATTTATAPPITSGTLTPGTTRVNSPTTTPTTHPSTTKPPVTTTRAPSTTTTTRAKPTVDVGITDDEIHLAVIADDPQTFQGMSAWMTVVNHHGGIAARKVRLDLLETGGTADGYANAVHTACGQDFAIVGSFSQFDAPTSDAGCGAIPDLPVQVVGSAHGDADNTYAAFPRRSVDEAVGPYRYLKDNVAGCCKQFWVVPDNEPARSHTQATRDAAYGVGFDDAGTVDLGDGNPPEPSYDEIVGDIESSGANFAASGLGRDSTIQLRQAADGHAADVKAWYCDASCYDADFLADGGDAVDHEYVSIETTPFGDRLVVGSLRTYVRTTVGAGDTTSYTGLRAYVTGMLFERAAGQVVDDRGNDGLTRARLLDALGSIHDFDAGGIVGATDVGGRAPNGCYVLLQVRDGRFRRVNPADKGSLDCGSNNLVQLGP